MINTSFHQFVFLCSELVIMSTDTSVTDGFAKWILLWEYSSIVKKSERVTEVEDSPCWKTAVIFLGMKRDLVHCISKVYVLSTKWCSLLLYSLTSAVYAKLITGVYTLAFWVLQCEFSPHTEGVYSRTVTGSSAIGTKPLIYVSRMGVLSPTCCSSFQMQKKEWDEMVIN